MRRVHTVFYVTPKRNIRWAQVSWIWVPSKVSPTSTPYVIKTLVSVVTYFRRPAWNCNVMLEYEYNMKWSVPTFDSWGRIHCCWMSRYGTQRIVTSPGKLGPYALDLVTILQILTFGLSLSNPKKRGHILFHKQPDYIYWPWKVTRKVSISFNNCPSRRCSSVASGDFNYANRQFNFD